MNYSCWCAQNGNTALHYAAFCNNFECVQLLLDAGADLTIENCGGFTPALLAARLNHREGMMSFLITIIRLFKVILNRLYRRVEVNISLAFLYWVGIALHP